MTHVLRNLDASLWGALLGQASMNLNPENLTVVGVLAFVVMALVNGWLVPGYVLRDEKEKASAALKAERERADRWEHRCVKNLEMVEEALKVANYSADALEKRVP